MVFLPKKMEANRKFPFPFPVVPGILLPAECLHSYRLEQEEGIDRGLGPRDVCVYSASCLSSPFSQGRPTPSQALSLSRGMTEVKFGKGTEAGSHFIACGGLHFTRQPRMASN